MGLDNYFDPANIKTVDKHCKGCKFLTAVSGVRACDFAGITGRSRPCPAGAGCTEKRVAKRQKVHITLKG